jgi:tRNA 2-thiocytidine biosynthesis protein TtcA
MIEIPRIMRQQSGQAISDYDMIREGDRVLIGLSGGKDSLSLLHVLLHKKKIAPIRFEVGAITVDPQIQGFNPFPLKEYMQELGTPYIFIAQPIAEEARIRMEGNTLCSYCSRMKRGIMYTVARKEGYNVLALGHHLDDLAEGFFMSVIHNGSLHTMKAHYLNEDGDIRIIRPLIYTREQDTQNFATNANLPIIPSKCPECSPHFRVPTQRRHIKQLLSEEEKKNPHLFQSILAAVKPLIHSYNKLGHAGTSVSEPVSFKKKC